MIKGKWLFVFVLKERYIKWYRLNVRVRKEDSDALGFLWLSKSIKPVDDFK